MIISAYLGFGVAIEELLIIGAEDLRVGNVVGPGTTKPGLKPLIREASTRETSRDFHGCVGSGGEIGLCWVLLL